MAEGGDLPGGGAGVDGVLDEVVGDDEHAGPPPRDHAVGEVQGRVQRGAPGHPTTHTAITHLISHLRMFLIVDTRQKVQTSRNVKVLMGNALQTDKVLHVGTRYKGKICL